MIERVPHQRSKGPPSTPAARLIELNREILRVSEQLASANHEIAVLKSKLDRYHRMNDTSFGGIAMAQQWADLWMWEAVLNNNPQLRAIYELGTWKGGFSWWLWAQAKARGLVFHTFDSVPHGIRLPPEAFTKTDVFASAPMLGSLFREWEPVILLCDNGNKPRELRTFAEQLQHHESLLVVHDWGTEIQPEDVPDTVEMVYSDFCEDLGAISRVFKLV